MELTNKISKLLSILVEMDSCDLILSKRLSKLFGFLLCLSSFFVLLFFFSESLLWLFRILHDYSHFVLQVILPFHHFSLHGDICGPLIILFVFEDGFLSSLRFVLLCKLTFQNIVIIFLLLGNFDHGFFDPLILFHALFKRIVLNWVNLAVTLANSCDRSIAILLQEDIIVSKIWTVRVNSNRDVEARINFDKLSHINNFR